AGEDADASRFLAGWLPDYRPEAPYHSHVSWHFAMQELVQGNIPEALATYKCSIDPAAVVPVRTTLADAVGLLWRAMIRGTAQPELPWQGLRAYVSHLPVDPSAPLRSALVALTFAGSGDNQAFEDAVAKTGVNGNGPAAAVLGPLLRGMHAFTR